MQIQHLLDTSLLDADEWTELPGNLLLITILEKIP